MRLRGELARGILLLGLVLALAGCRHRDPQPALPIPPAVAVPVVTPPSPPESLTPIPVVPAPLTPVVVSARRVRKTRKKPSASIAAAASPAAAPAAGAAAPAPSILPGALTPGGEQTPEKQQQAQELIEGLRRRLAGLAPALQQDQKEQIARVLSFESEAVRALRGGDADGAMTLATKARVLLDEITR